MTKKILLSTVCALAVCPAFAQTPDVEETVEYSKDKYKVETNRFWDNTFISVGGGAQIYFGDHDKQAKFGERIAPALDVALGKWFTPGVGVRVAYSGLQQRGATKHPGDKNEDSSHGTGKPVDGGGAPHWLERQKFNYGNVHVDVLFNFSNLLCGYNPNRVWNVSPYLGVGYANVYDKPRTHEVTANIGVLNTWKLCKALLLNLDIHGMYAHDRLDGEQGHRFGDGMLTASLGLTYRFNSEREWYYGKTVTRIDNAALNELRRQLDEMTAENNRLKEALAKGDKETERVIVKNMAAANLVVFKINKSKLSNEARANLGMLAEVIKQGDKDAVYTITGYADKGTGTTAINERLSRERAQAVYNCLTKEFGVSKDQLTIDYKGGVENMFYDDPRLSRAVITKAK